MKRDDQAQQAMGCTCETPDLWFGEIAGEGSARVVDVGCRACGGIGLLRIPHDPIEYRGRWPQIEGIRRAFAFDLLHLVTRRRTGDAAYVAWVQEEVGRRACREARDEAMALVRRELVELQSKVEAMARAMAARSGYAAARRLAKRGYPTRAVAHLGPMQPPSTIYAIHAAGAPAAVRYVGKAIAPAARLQQHATAQTPVGAWIRSVIASGGSVTMSELEVAPAEIAAERERHHIEAHIRRGLADLNQEPFAVRLREQALQQEACA